MSDFQTGGLIGPGALLPPMRAICFVCHRAIDGTVYDRLETLAHHECMSRLCGGPTGDGQAASGG